MGAVLRAIKPKQEKEKYASQQKPVLLQMFLIKTTTIGGNKKTPLRGEHQ